MARLKWHLPDSGFPGQFLLPKPFFIGVFAGFLICCLLGFICSTNQHFENFKRFHFYISPYTLYYPSYGQLLSLVKPARPDQVIVIIGGTSLFNGFGQNENELWSEELKKKLGDKFYVVNLAFDGAASFECGSWVAETLIKQNRKVIFITTCEPTHMNPACGLLMKKVFLEFRSKNVLLDSEQRNDVVNDLLDQSNSKSDNKLIEYELGTRVDQLTNSSELWQWVGHHLFFTMWCEGTHPNFLRPRRLAEDNFVPKFNRELDFYEAKKNALVTEHNSLLRLNGTSRQANEPMWLESDRNADAIPTDLLRHSIIFVPRYNPDLTNLFSTQQREIYDAVLNIAAEKWRAKGADSAVLGTNFTASNYCDMGHFSPEGAQVVAVLVAEKIKQNARRLSYE